MFGYKRRTEMGLLQWLFGSQRPDKMRYAEAMSEMAREAERTYRGMIATYNGDVGLGMLSAPSKQPVAPTGRGLYKARLFGALFMATAYARSGPVQQEAEEMFNAATGVALESLQGSGDIRLTRDEAKAFTMPLLISVIKSMTAAFNAGPFLPGEAQPAHLALTEHLHDALAESLGTDRYTPQVRERFAPLIQANVAMALNHASQWVAR
jgi:hypothetical protein